MKDKQLFKEGDTIKIKGVELKCSLVTYRERDGKKEQFTYSFQPVIKESKE